MNENLIVTAENSNLPKMNVIQRIFSTIFSPGKLMEELARKPRVVLGIILTILAPIITIYGTFPMYMEYMRPLMEVSNAKSSNPLSPEAFEQFLTGTVISTPIMVGLGAAVILLVEALILWLVLKIFKGEGSFKQYLSVFGYSAVIAVLGSIVSVAAMQISGLYSDVTYTSLASLLPEMKGSFVFGFARSLDVFYIWQYIVASIGIATVSKIDKKKAYLIMACIFIILACFTGYSEVRAYRLLN